MLYEELKSLTRGEAAYDEFLIIEKLYMADEGMTKRQAAALWSKNYGPAARYKKNMETAGRLNYQDMSRVWKELYSNKVCDYKDSQTKLRFTLLSWHHPKLNKDVLTLAVLLKKENPITNSIVMPLPMTDVGENITALWLNFADPEIMIIKP